MLQIDESTWRRVWEGRCFVMIGMLKDVERDALQDIATRLEMKGFSWFNAAKAGISLHKDGGYREKNHAHQKSVCPH